jgi:O-antigen/teichoic acid export membrane protein
MGVARNAGYNIAGTLIPLVVSVATVPLYIRVVGVERYGVLALCWLILGFLGFLNFGMGPAIAQRLASLAEAPEAEREQVFWAGTWLSLAMGAVGAALVLLIGGGYFQSLSSVPSSFSAEIRQALPWLALMMPIVLVGGVFSGALQGRAQFLTMNLLNCAGSVLMSLLPLGAALWLGPRLATLIGASVAGRVLILAFTYLACARTVPAKHVRRPQPALMRRLAAFGGWVTITSLLVPIVVTMDRFVIGAVAGAAAVTIYTIPYNLVSRMTILGGSLASALYPRFATATPTEADDLAAEGASALVSLLTPLTVLLIATLGPFLQLWIGHDLAGRSAPVAYVLVFGFWVNSTAQIPYVFLEARGRPELNAIVHIVYVIPYLAVLYFCLSTFGVLGAAMAWTMRSFFDPVLYVLAGNFRRVLPIIAPPGLLVAGATAVALICPWTSTLHWVLLALLLCASLLLSLRFMPDSARAQFRRALSQLRVRDRFA